MKNYELLKEFHHSKVTESATPGTRQLVLKTVPILSGIVYLFHTFLFPFGGGGY